MSWIKPELSGIAPQARSLHMAEMMGHRLYIYGGWTRLMSDDSQGDQWKVTSDLACLNMGEEALSMPSLS